VTLPNNVFSLTAATDLATAAQRKLVSVPSVVELLGSSVPPEPAGVWLFVRELQTSQVEGSGKAAVVVREEGGWTRPNQHNTARFPRLSVEIFADCSRDPLGNIIRRDAEARARAVWERFQQVLHRVDAFSEVWGSTPYDPGVRVWGSQLQSFPDAFGIADWEGGIRLQSYYGLSTG
jgi:hypothetical protein